MVYDYMEMTRDLREESRIDQNVLSKSIIYFAICYMIWPENLIPQKNGV